jgi:predicted peptidase
MIAWCLLTAFGWFLISWSWPLTDLGSFDPPGMVPSEIRWSDDMLYRYVVYVPREYDGVHPLPLIVFLHGSGRDGVDGRQQLMIGLGPEVYSRHINFRAFPYFVLFPQARHPWSADANDVRAVMAALDRTLAAYRIDPDRVYLTGISDGGDGAWELAAAYPDRWAALIPISCGGARIQFDRIKRLPIRWYQNTGDRIHNVRDVVDKLKRAGSPAELIEFDDPSHDAWARAYSDPGLYRWLNRQARHVAGSASDALSTRSP